MVAFIPCISYDQTAKDCSNSSTRSSHSDGGSSSSNELGSSVDVTAHCTGLETSQTHLSEGRLRQQSSRSLNRMSNVHDDLVHKTSFKCSEFVLCSRGCASGLGNIVDPHIYCIFACRQTECIFNQLLEHITELQVHVLPLVYFLCFFTLVTNLYALLRRIVY